MTERIRVAMVEDDAGFRQTLQRVFTSAPDFQVIAACANAESALHQIPDSGCDLVLMDIQLPGMSGIDCLRALKARTDAPRVVMLTAYDDNDNLFNSLVAGADGFLLKRFDRDRLIEAAREIVVGGAPISPPVARRMVEYFHRLKTVESPDAAPVPDAKTDQLTARELEVLSLLASGSTPKEIAGQLAISWQTVRNFIKSIYSKLHVHNRTDAVLTYLGRPPSTEARG